MARLHSLAFAVLILFSTSVFAIEPIRVANEGDIKQVWTLPPGTHLAAAVYPTQFC